MRDLPYWLKVMSALATPAIAVLGIAIAWGQWTTARSRLILDLFERRREIYGAFRGPVGEAIREGRADTAIWVEFRKVVDQAQFLFGREVLEFIEERSEALNNMALATRMLAADRTLSHEERDRFICMQDDAMKSLGDFYPGLVELMVPYMLMDQKRPWTISRVFRWFGSRWSRVTKGLGKRWRKKRAPKVA